MEKAALAWTSHRIQVTGVQLISGNVGGCFCHLRELGHLKKPPAFWWPLPHPHPSEVLPCHYLFLPFILCLFSFGWLPLAQHGGITRRKMQIHTRGSCVHSFFLFLPLGYSPHHTQKNKKKTLDNKFIPGGLAFIHSFSSFRRVTPPTTHGQTKRRKTWITNSYPGDTSAGSGEKAFAFVLCPSPEWSTSPQALHRRALRT